MNNNKKEKRKRRNKFYWRDSAHHSLLMMAVGIMVYVFGTLSGRRPIGSTHVQMHKLIVDRSPRTVWHRKYGLCWPNGRVCFLSRTYIRDITNKNGDNQFFLRFFFVVLCSFRLLYSIIICLHVKNSNA